MALEIAGWKTFSPCLNEYVSKSFKATNVSAVDIMDVVDLVFLCVFNLWSGSNNSSRILLKTFVNMVELAGSLQFNKFT